MNDHILQNSSNHCECRHLMTHYCMLQNGCRPKIFGIYSTYVIGKVLTVVTRNCRSKQIDIGNHARKLQAHENLGKVLVQ